MLAQAARRRRHCPYGADQLIAWCVFEQKAARAGLQDLVEVLLEVEGREDEDAGDIAVPKQALRC